MSGYIGQNRVVSILGDVDAATLDGIDGIDFALARTIITDADTTYVAGNYRVNNTTTGIPVSEYGGLIVSGDGTAGGITSQLFISSSTGVMYRRGRQSSVWTAWVEVIQGPVVLYSGTSSAFTAAADATVVLSESMDNFTAVIISLYHTVSTATGIHTATINTADIISSYQNISKMHIIYSGYGTQIKRGTNVQLIFLNTAGLTTSANVKSIIGIK